MKKIYKMEDICEYENDALMKNYGIRIQIDVNVKVVG